MINALDVANTILVQGNKEDIDISPMKLQKLIYILYKEYLKETKMGLFSELFEVWKYGPVIPSVYDAFSSYGSKPIKSYYMNRDKTYNTVKIDNNTAFSIVFNKVWNLYKHKDGIFLSKLTHLDGTAWKKALDSGNQTLKDVDIYSEESYERFLQ